MHSTSSRKAGARGVSFDKRRGRYRARITVDGAQRWVGSFETEAEASALYERMRAERERGKAERREAAAPPVVPRGPSAADVLEEIRAQAASQWRGEHGGRPEPVRFVVGGVEYGDVFAVVRPWQAWPQVYEFQRKGWSWFRGKAWALWVWRSQCAAEDCGEVFEVSLPADVRRLTVPSAFCKAHRRPGKTPRGGRKAWELVPYRASPGTAATGQKTGPSVDAGGGGRGPEGVAEALGIADLV